MTEKEKNKQVIKISVFITSIFVIVLSLSFAFTSRLLEGSKRQVITVGNPKIDLDLDGEANSITLNNAMPVYDEVGMLGESYDFTVTNYEDVPANYVLSLIDITEDKENELDYYHIKYGLTINGETTINLLSDTRDNNLIEGIIEANQVLKCNLRLWLDIDAPSATANKTIKYKVALYGSPLGDVINKDKALFPKVTDVAFRQSKLGENCKTYNDGVDTFLVGQCQNNYVWYSGKLWRVVLKNNETGTVKMVTDNAITAIPYNSDRDITFENSYMDQWLNQEFLPTLHDYQNYLVVDSVWDATLDSSSTPSRPVGTNTVTRTVGLLNVYEYATTYNKSDGLAHYGNGYLANRSYCWFITPRNAWSLWHTNDGGELYSKDPLYGYGARPSVNLKSTTYIIRGRGTQSNPYRLEGDSKELVNGTTLISTRYSGEYIHFNNELYRIVETENSLTKITAVDKPTELTDNPFHSTNDATNFASSSIKTDLETYYQSNIIEPYKSMIEPNTTWYLGTVGNGDTYKTSICKTVNQEVSASTCERIDTTTTASVGLPRVGEMFTSQITRRRRRIFWTLTPYSDASARFIFDDGELSSDPLTEGDGARPSMYLKSNVVIAKNNTGDGTYEHPYDIELLGS